MKTSALKKEIFQAIDDTTDNEVLEIVYAILKKTNKENEEDYPELSSSQKKELDKRLANHKAGKLKYYTIDQVRKTVSKALKK